MPCEIATPRADLPAKNRRDRPHRVVLDAGLATLLVLSTAGGGAAQPACVVDPASLRQDRVYRDLKFNRSEECAAELAGLAGDPALAWDLRARALTLLPMRDHAAAFAAFARDFGPASVAAGETGAATFNLLAAWLPEVGAERELVEPLLLPGPGMTGVGAVLDRLAGEGLHEYLWLLWRKGYRLDPERLRRLASTDDQDTRRFLCWYVGERAMVGMEGFLVDQVASSRPSTYPGQAERLLTAAFTAGLSELVRAALPKPPWLGDETTPKGLAVASLGRLLPAGQPITQRDLAARLAAVAAGEATGTDRSQWQLAADIVALLLERKERPDPEVTRALDGLARQCLRKRGPLRPFELAEAITSRYGLPFPSLTPEERGRVWDVTLTTLNAPFLGAVTRALPDPERRKELEQHLLGQSDKAADGSLRVVRCWGADLEAPGDWCACVAELGLESAIPSVEKVLTTAWADQAVAALVRLGPAAVPALTRHLRTPRAGQVKAPLRAAAVRLCLASLSGSERESLLTALEADPVLAETLRGVLGAPHDR